MKICTGSTREGILRRAKVLRQGMLLRRRGQRSGLWFCSGAGVMGISRARVRSFGGACGEIPAAARREGTSRTRCSFFPARLRIHSGSPNEAARTVFSGDPLIFHAVCAFSASLSAPGSQGRYLPKPLIHSHLCDRVAGSDLGPLRAQRARACFIQFIPPPPLHEILL